MPQLHTHSHAATAPERLRPGVGLGERVRQRRVSLGLTQTDLAGERFSKEYISQIELGKTRPTQETLAYLASVLRTDPGYLAHGVSSEDQARIEAMLTRAEALAQDQRFEEAVSLYQDATTAVAACGAPELEVRRTAGEAWAQMEQGDVRKAVDRLVAAKTLAEHESVSEVYLAEVLWKLAVGRLKLGSTHVALGLLNEAFSLTERASAAPDRQRFEILRWRCVVYQRLKDVDSAKNDAELALELAERLEDPRSVANAYFQASLVAEREGRYVAARSYAERARSKFEEAADQIKVGSVLNNLALIQFELGKSDDALASLKRAYGVLLDAGDSGRCALVVASLASLHLETGDSSLAEEQARHALELFGEGSDEWTEEIAESKIILGRALLAQDRLEDAEAALSEAQSAFEAMRSTSNLARAIFSRGDVASKRGAHEEASRLYRHSASLLQDVKI
ncbi:MAG: helix-turn-helix domain-containing protein [Gaiellaceae bacterium]